VRSLPDLITGAAQAHMAGLAAPPCRV
jgi:hypothetical protein